MNFRIRKGINFRTVSIIDLPSFPDLLSFHDHSTAFLNSYSSATRSRAGLCDDRTGRRTDRARLCVENYVNSFQRRYRLRIFPLRNFLPFLVPSSSRYTRNRRSPYIVIRRWSTHFPVFITCRSSNVRVCGDPLSHRTHWMTGLRSPIARPAKILLLPVYARCPSANNIFPVQVRGRHVVAPARQCGRVP